MYLAIRTDSPQAELYIHDGKKIIAQQKWQAHRELSATIHTQLGQLCRDAGCKIDELNGIIFYSGPGSFTGLRIGVSVANALGASFNAPVVAVTSDSWINTGIMLLAKSPQLFEPVEPTYGGSINITESKK